MSTVVVTQGTTRTVQVATAGPQGVRGAQGWVWRGPWDIDTDYAAEVVVGGVVTVGADVVHHDGSAWLAVADSTGVEPTALAAEWELIAEKGEPTTLTVTATTLPVGEPATATISGDAPAQAITFGLPTGATGAAGPTGPANSLAIGTVTTGAPGSSAAASITGTAPSQTLSLTVPRGATGASILSGTGAPSSGLGLDADYYLDTATSNLYGPKAAGAWPAPVSLVGAPSSLYDANTILAANTDNTPAALTIAEQRIVGRKTGGSIAALTATEMFALAPATDPAPLGPELGTGSGLSQTVTTVVGQTYQVGGASVTAITLDGAALVVSNNYSSFKATGTSHTLVGTGGSVLSVKQITGTSTATVTLAGMTVRRYAGLFSAGIGTDSQRSLTTGSYNNAVGHNAQSSLTTGSYNNAVGHNAQSSLTTGSYNSAVGYDAQSSLTTGSYNSAVGHNAQSSLTTGLSNSAVGYTTQRSLTTGSYNNAVGYATQRFLTTGLSNNAVGHSAQYSLTTGSSNSAVGHNAQYAPKGVTANATTTASYQTAVGHESGQYSAATGDKGVALGYRAIYHTGAVAVGSDSEAQGTDSIAIGRAAVASAANTIQLGATGTAYTLSFGNAGRVIGLTELKSIVAAAADFAAFKAAIAALS